MLVQKILWLLRVRLACHWYWACVFSVVHWGLLRNCLLEPDSWLSAWARENPLLKDASEIFLMYCSGNWMLTLSVSDPLWSWQLFCCNYQLLWSWSSPLGTWCILREQRFLRQGSSKNRQTTKNCPVFSFLLECWPLAVTLQKQKTRAAKGGVSGGLAWVRFSEGVLVSVTSTAFYLGVLWVFVCFASLLEANRRTWRFKDW